MEKSKILIIDDHKEILDYLKELLEEEYEVEVAQSGIEAFSLFQKSVFPVVLSDIKMPNGDGLELLRKIKLHNPATQVILTSGDAIKEDLEKAFKLRAFSYIEKGSESAIEETLEAIEDAFKEYRENKEKLNPEISSLETILSYPVITDKIPKGIEYYESFLKKNPNNFDALLELSKFYYRNSQFYMAIKYLRKSFEIKPQDVEVIYFLGNSFSQISQYINAKEMLEKAVFLKPDYAEAYFSLGVVHGRQKNYQGAIDNFQKALDLKEDYVEALRSIGVAYGEIKEYEKALEYLTKSTRITNARKFLSYLSIGLIYRETKHYDKAIFQLEKALEARPNDAFIMMILGTVYSEYGNSEKYEDLFIKAFRTDPKLAFGSYGIQKNKALKLQETEVELDTQKDMLSFLTHTLRSSFAGAPTNIDQSLRFIKRIFQPPEMDSSLIKRLSFNLAELKNIFTTVDNMIDIFEIYTANRDDFLPKWNKDQAGAVRIKQLFAVCLKQTIARILFEDSFREELQSLIMTNEESKLFQVRETFQDQLFDTDPLMGREQVIFQWARDYFPVLVIDICPQGFLVNPGGIRFGFLFACLSELLLNSFKYCTPKNKVYFRFLNEENEYVFQCQNHFNEMTTKKSGSRKGLDFVQALSEISPEIIFSYKKTKDIFTANLRLNKTLLSSGE